MATESDPGVKTVRTTCEATRADRTKLRDDEFPLQLLSLKNPRFRASQALESLQDETPIAWLHPETAARLGVRENALGWLESAHGSYAVRFGLDDGIRPDVCVGRAGGWLKKNHGINVLTGDVLSTSGETPGYYETRVRVVTSDRVQ